MSMLDNKWYISAQDLYEFSIDLCKQIIEDGFRPDFIIGVWRGGTPIGITVHEFLEHCGIASDHIAIRTSSYNGMKRRSGEIKIDSLEYVIQNITSEKKLLIVDDVFDTGLSIEAIINALQQRCENNYPGQLRIATPFYKPANNKTQIQPDYCIHSTDRWLVFPHELKGLSDEELMTHKQYVYQTLQSLKQNHYL